MVGPECGGAALVGDWGGGEDWEVSPDGLGADGVDADAGEAGEEEAWVGDGATVAVETGEDGIGEGVEVAVWVTTTVTAGSGSGGGSPG